MAAYDVVAARRPPYTGIWVGEEKLAAIGVKLASGVTTHGAALNVSTDLGWFAEVIPCGIAGAGVASLASLGVRPAPRLHDVAVRFATEFARVIGRQPRPAGEAVRAAIAEAAAVPGLSAQGGSHTGLKICRRMTRSSPTSRCKPTNLWSKGVVTATMPLQDRPPARFVLSTFFHPPSGRASRGILRWQPSSAIACSIS